MAEPTAPAAELLFSSADAVPISTDESTVKSWAEARTRPASRKGRNLELKSQCVITVSTEPVDLVVECDATEVTGDANLQRVADGFVAKYGWRLTVRDGHAYEDSLPGSPRYNLYELTPALGFGFGPDGMTATRWRF